MTKMNIQLDLPIEFNLDELDGITIEDIEKQFQYALGAETSHRAPFHIEMLHRGFHETLKVAIKEAVEALHIKRHQGYVETVSKNGKITTATPKWILTSAPIIKRFIIDHMGVWACKLKEV